MKIILDLNIDQTNLPKVLVVHLFSAYKDYITEAQSVHQASKRLLLILFEEVFKGFYTWADIDKVADNPIEALALGATKVNLKDNLKKLITDLIEFFKITKFEIGFDPVQLEWCMTDNLKRQFKHYLQGLPVDYFNHSEFFIK